MNLQHYEKNKTPVVLKNLVAKEDEDWIFNQQAVVHQAAPSDITFKYAEQPKPTGVTNVPAPTTVTVSQINELKPNQKINITAIVTIGSDKPKPVVLKASNETTYVKEDCVLEDATGVVMAHIWHPLLNEIKSGQSYLFKHLTVRNFQGSTFLSSSYLTTVSPTTLTLNTLQGPNMLKNPDKDITARNIKFVSKLAAFSSCQVCKKRINDVECAQTLKCQNCGTRQRYADLNRQASIRLCVSCKGQDIWLQAFTDHLTAMFGDSNITLQSTVDDVEEHLMSLEDIKIKYNVQTKNITEIVSFKINTI